MINQGTSINSRILNRMTSNLNFTMYNISQNHTIMRSNGDANLVQRKIGENDIVCGRSFCGSQEQPTWQFCFGGK